MARENVFPLQNTFERVLVMAHELDIVDGVATMAFAGDRSAIWHGLGSNVEGETLYNVAAMMDSAKANYEVAAYELQTIPQTEGEEPRKIPDVRYLYRKDNGRLLASVGPEYTILQNSDAFANFQPWLDSKAARLDTCGVIRGGQKAWMQAVINMPPGEVVKGDYVENRILLCNTFCGMQAVHFGFTKVRTVCSNTLGMAIKDKASKLLRVRHHANVKENVSRISEIMDLATQEFSATIEQYKLLANKGVNEADVRTYVKVLFGYDDVDMNLSTRSKNMIEDIIETVHSGKGQDVAVGSAWWLYNGCNNYLNHKDGRDIGDSRRDSIWFGANAKLDKKAFDMAMALATAA